MIHVIHVIYMITFIFLIFLIFLYPLNINSTHTNQINPKNHSSDNK